MSSDQKVDEQLPILDFAVKKRRRSHSKGNLYELSPKRLRRKVESITRVFCNTDEDSMDAVAGISEGSTDLSQLILENQKLRLESMFKAELHSLEKDTLRWVTELKTENRLLKQEICRLKKDNIAFRCGRETPGRLKKCEIERRQKKFPWLPFYARNEELSGQPLQKGKVNFEWKDLPSDVTFAILKMLSDEELFVLRGLCTQFYEAFYCQEDRVDCERCIWLAKRGRKFANLKFILALNDFTWKEFRVLGPSNFPKLEVLWLGNSSPRLMVPHANLKELQFTALDYEDLHWVSDKKFPSLEVLIFTPEEDLFEEEHPNRLRLLSGHKNLVRLGLGFLEPSLEEIQQLTSVKFPRLKTVGFPGDLEDVPDVFEYLQKVGIEFTNNIEKLSTNQSRYSWFRKKRYVSFLAASY